MVPIPQYPLYSATISEYGMTKVDYYLEEETGWSLKKAELQRSFDEAKKTCTPRALVVINPGNPTGQVLTRDNIVEIIKFAHENQVLILADEVYQDNVYDKNSKFWSFKKVAYEMGEPYRSQEMVSFLSTSKGYLGECGIRGGYMEVLNLDPKVKAMLTKSITAALCSTTAGQVAVSALVNPPQPGEPSYDLYKKERDGILAALKERAELVHKTLSSFEGYKVNPVQGAMYVFPQIEIPPKAVEAAKAKGMAPDVFYAFELLETSGEYSVITQECLSSSLSLSLSPNRHLHCSWQRIWPEAWHLSLPQHDPAADGQAEADDGEVPRVPRRLHEEVQVDDDAHPPCYPCATPPSRNPLPAPLSLLC